MANQQHKKRDTVTQVSSATAHSYKIYQSTATGGTEKIPVSSGSYAVRARVPDKVAEKAVYNHLRLLRSQGRSIVGADEVARSLSLPIPQVERVVGKLRVRGVRVER